MNTEWSIYIQKIETLNRHRSLRFNDYSRKLFMDAFNIEGSPKILELGCGSGILSDVLNNWYPGSSITGIDRDTGFINYCRSRYSQNKNLEFIEADTESLPFRNESFDIVISHLEVKL